MCLFDCVCVRVPPRQQEEGSRVGGRVPSLFTPVTLVTGLVEGVVAKACCDRFLQKQEQQLSAGSKQNKGCRNVFSDGAATADRSGRNAVRNCPATDASKIALTVLLMICY